MTRSGWAASAAIALLVWAAQGVAQEAQVTDAVSTAPQAVPLVPSPQTAALPEITAPRDPNFGSVTNLPLPRYVSLKTNEGNARRGPGLTHRIDWVFTRAGMPLRITAEFDKWRRVEDADGVGGWVHYALLSGVRTALVTQDMAEFRTLPDADASVGFQAELGVVGRILECEADWCRMSVDGQRGWVRQAALWGVLEGEIIE